MSKQNKNYEELEDFEYVLRAEDIDTENYGVFYNGKDIGDKVRGLIMFDKSKLGIRGDKDE